ncbi:hypothetical protein ACNKF0_12955 [Nocardioides sp. T5]|uniref:hypothetical protein n=1 Tax=Nocardioides sp. T5 TaxID=3400182 RepID=UPI003A857BEF
MIRVALDGLRSRALLSVGTLLLLVVALGSAVLGPAFAAAVGNAYAVTRLSDERNVLTGRTWEVRPSATTEDPGALLDDTLAQARPAGRPARPDGPGSRPRACSPRVRSAR